MERPLKYTTAMTRLKWDNPEDYDNIQKYIDTLRDRLEKCEEVIQCCHDTCFDAGVIPEETLGKMEKVLGGGK